MIRNVMLKYFFTELLKLSLQGNFMQLTGSTEPVGGKKSSGFGKKKLLGTVG